MKYNKIKITWKLDRENQQKKNSPREITRIREISLDLQTTVRGRSHVNIRWPFKMKSMTLLEFMTHSTLYGYFLQ